MTRNSLRKKKTWMDIDFVIQKDSKERERERGGGGVFQPGLFSAKLEAHVMAVWVRVSAADRPNATGKEWHLVVPHHVVYIPRHTSSDSL